LEKFLLYFLFGIGVGFDPLQIIFCALSRYSRYFFIYNGEFVLKPTI